MWARLRNALVTVTAAATALVTTASPAAAVVDPYPAFSCRYDIKDEWPGGFMADIYVLNKSAALTTWVVRWRFNQPTRIGAVWDAVIRQDPYGTVLATPGPFNANVRPYAVFSFGWSGFAATTEVPNYITVNNYLCFRA
ncbi:cellulose binding domain-containing protein [Luedemannella helvata]|uniref:CBM2 domain-containing protein n=1 Tax=Luedemannella helvata TaxID=349315 RepID=A0ABP4WYD1_9ACTN